MEERIFDARIWKAGKSKVITLPSSIIKGIDLKVGMVIKVTIEV